MKASELPAIDGAPHFMVRANHTWGRAPTLEKAITIANVGRGDKVHVCRCDEDAYCDEISGSMFSSKRGEIWSGTVYSRRDITLKEVTHQMKK